MSDVRLASASSAVSVVTGGGSHGSQPPAFVLPPRNVRVALGGKARLEGKVRAHVMARGHRRGGTCFVCHTVPNVSEKSSFGLGSNDVFNAYISPNYTVSVFNVSFLGNSRNKIQKSFPEYVNIICASFIAQSGTQFSSSYDKHVLQWQTFQPYHTHSLYVKHFIKRGRGAEHMKCPH